MSYDSVAELLSYIKLTKPANVSKNKLETAIHYHNTMREKLQKYEDKDGKNYQEKRKANNQGHHGESRALERANTEIKRLEEKNDSLMKQMEELKLRFSKIAGDKMMDGNPNITDLSDQYRPTKLAEYFRTLYDEEWTQAFEDLEKSHTGEGQILEQLADIIQKADEFCTKAEKQQMDNIEKFKEYIIAAIHKPSYKVSKDICLGGDMEQNEIDDKEHNIVRKQLRELRKSLSHLSIEPFAKMFFEFHSTRRDDKNLPCTKGIELFSKKLIKIIWMMKIQEPPIELSWQQPGERFKKDMFSEYTQRGGKVVRTVWPAMILHKDGPLMAKGVVQVKD